MSGPVTNIHTSGRCKNRSCRRGARSEALYWPKRLMRLTEAVCPACGHPLAQTSRDYQGGFDEMTPPQIVACLDRALAQLRTRLDEQRASLNRLQGFEREMTETYIARDRRLLDDRWARYGRAVKHAAEQRRAEVASS